MRSLFTRRQPGGLVFLDGAIECPGLELFVDSVNGSDAPGNGQTPDQPLASIAYAHGLCTAGQGDTIYCRPGHVETIAAAAALTLSKSGVAVIGLGRGTLRPAITCNGTDSQLVISGANVLLRNVLLVAGIDEVVSAISLSGAFCVLDGVDVVETTAKQFIQFLKTTTAGDDVTIRNCKHRQATAAAAAQLWIELVGTDRAVIEDNDLQLTLQNGATCAVITSTGTAPKGITIRRNCIVQLGGTTQVSAILLMAATTGDVYGNRVAAGVTTLAGTVALASCYGADNLTSHTVNKSGILDPVVDS